MPDTRDPYGRCEARCNHDLANGVTVAELLGRDGPFEDRLVALLTATPRPVVQHPLVRAS
ncbi:MAG TPA: hypothetical protein VGC47_03590 [Acidimicrobiia bacterium]